MSPELVGVAASALVILSIIGLGLAGRLGSASTGSAAGPTPIETPAATSTAPPPTPAPSPLPTQGPLAATIISEGFETGDLRAWTVNDKVTITSTEHFAGFLGARVTATGAGAFIYRDVPAQTDLETSVRLKILGTPSGSIYLIRTASIAGKYGGGVYRTGSGAVAFRNSVTGTTTTSATTMSIGVWHELRLRQVIAGRTGSVEIWLDGVHLADVSGTADLGTEPIGRFQIGDDNDGRTFDFAFDEARATGVAAALASPAPSAATGSPGTASSPPLAASTIADLQVVIVSNARIRSRSTALEALTEATPADSGAITEQLRGINLDISTALDAADRLSEDPVTSGLGTDLHAVYDDIRDHVRQGLALGLANVEGNVAAGRATAQAIAALEPLDERSRKIVGSGDR